MSKGLFTTMYIFVCCCSVVQSCLTLCYLMDCSTPDFPVHHHLLELAQTRVHGVGDAIQPSFFCCPVSSCPQSFPTSQASPYIHIFCSLVNVYMLSAPWINDLFRQLTFLCGWSTAFHSLQLFCFLVFIYLAEPDLRCHMWDLSSLTRDRSRAPCTGSTES